ncbi:acyltransferase family protein [Brucella intermedia]|uniref:acyltransferase family protein n=1 Tax=Brucella intermedia TaxID=94625 RepID=UPI00224A8B04|nr:acyltransferase family protein [Brucella intermedia]
MDALKGAAILLVVIGHALEGLLASQFNYYLYSVIYSFHMPLFVFLAGLHAKSSLTERDASNIVKRIVLPFIVFQVAYTQYVHFVPGWVYGPLQPYWILWFLVSLFAWRLLLPVFASPTGLMVAAVMGIAAGSFPQIGGDFSLSRTFYFFPFFIFGSIYGFDLLQSIDRHRKWAWCWLAAAIVGVTVWTHYGLNPITLRGSEPYLTYRAFKNEPEMGRALVWLVALMGIVGFCAIVPRKSKPLEYLGKNVFAIYLFHGFLIMAFKNYLAPMVGSGMAGLLIVLVGTVGICFALAPLQKHMERGFNGLYRLMDKVSITLTPKHRQRG